MGGLGCCSRFAKYFLFLFNIIFWIVGVVLLAAGIWVLVDKDALQLLHVATVDSSDTLVRGAAITFVVLGAIVFLTGFLGCCGACRESPCMLMTYAWIVIIVFVLQLVAGIMGAVFQNKIKAELERSMNVTVSQKYGQANESTTTTSWDFMQRTFHCCGSMTGPSDWEESYWKLNVANSSQAVPDTCCVLSNEDKVNEAADPVNRAQCNIYAAMTDPPTNQTVLYTKGCQPQLYDWVVNHAAILIGIAFGLAFVQIFGVVIACTLHKKITNLYEYV